MWDAPFGEPPVYTIGSANATTNLAPLYSLKSEIKKARDDENPSF